MVASAVPSLDHVQATFLAALPRIERHAKVIFRAERCPEKKADLIAEVRALTWKWWRRLLERQKNPMAFVSTLATFACRAVKSGRRVCGQLRPRDVLSERARQKHGFTVSSLPQISTLNANPLSEALTDNTVSPVPDQVQFRCDFPEWLTLHSPRDRKIAIEMAKGERTKALAHRFKISPARCSQLRRYFHDSWESFTGEEAIVAVAS